MVVYRKIQSARGKSRDVWKAIAMKKCFFKKVILTAAVSLVFAPTAQAHQPRLVGDEANVIVTLPEVSKAYYGNLAGNPAAYRIEAADDFRLYVNILVPDIEGIEKNVSAKIFKQGKLISLLDGLSHDWKSFYEPFAGDDYYRGPEFVEVQEPGVYEIHVYSPDNRGKYVLAIGDREAFPFGELVKTYLVLPRLKSEFFGKSPFSAYSNIMGIFLAVILIALLLLVTALSLLIRRIRKRWLRVKMKSDINNDSS